MISEFQSYMAAAERIFHLLDEEPERDLQEAGRPETVAGQVIFSMWISAISRSSRC